MVQVNLVALSEDKSNALLRNVMSRTVVVALSSG
jgi:hypothetical protein